MSTVSLYSELSNMRRTKVWNINWVHVVTTTFFRPSVAKVTAGQRWLATGDFLAGFVTNSFTPLKKKISIELNYFNIKSHHKKHPMVGHLPPLKQLDRRSNKDIATLLTEHVLHNNIATTCGAASWCCLSDFITATSPSLTNTSFHVTAPPQQPHTHTHTSIVLHKLRWSFSPSQRTSQKGSKYFCANMSPILRDGKSYITDTQKIPIWLM